MGRVASWQAPTEIPPRCCTTQFAQSNKTVLDLAPDRSKAMKNNDDQRMLEHKRRIDAERREKAIARQRQQVLRDTTPGTATPASLMRFIKPVSA